MAALQHRSWLVRRPGRQRPPDRQSGRRHGRRRPGEHGGGPARGHPRIVRRLRPCPGPERDQPPGRPAQVDRAPAGQPAVRGGLAGAEQRRLPGRAQAARARQRRPAADRAARGRVQAPALARPAHRPGRAPRHPRPRRGGLPRPGDHHPGLAAHPGGRPPARLLHRARQGDAGVRGPGQPGVGADGHAAAHRVHRHRAAGDPGQRSTARGRPASPTTGKRPTRAWAASRPPSAAATGSSAPSR